MLLKKSPLIILLLTAGCISLRPGGIHSGKKLFETFFVGIEGTQYYIKPITFKSGKSEKLVLDMTFRFKNLIKDSATVNMSFIGFDIIKNIDSLKITNDSTSLLLTKINLMFIERSGKMYNSRFSVKSYLGSINKLFYNDNWTINIYSNKINKEYVASRGTKKKLTKLKYDIFELIEK